MSIRYPSIFSSYYLLSIILNLSLPSCVPLNHDAKVSRFHRLTMKSFLFE